MSPSLVTPPRALRLWRIAAQLLFVACVSSSIASRAAGYPRVAADFIDCPTTYLPLVSRVVELEMEYPLLDTSSTEVDYRLIVTCIDENVQVQVEAGQQQLEPVAFDLSTSERDSVPRVIGLQIAYLLEEVTVDWAPPKDPVPMLPPELPPALPAAAPLKPLTVETPIAKSKPIPTPTWHLGASAGVVVLGPAVLLGGHGNMGVLLRAARLPLSFSLDVDITLGKDSTTQGGVRALTVAPGLFVHYETEPASLFSFRGGVGYRAGWIDLRGLPPSGESGLSVSGLWHGPAFRLGPTLNTNAVTFSLMAEVGYGVRRVVGVVDNESDVTIHGPWTSIGLGAELPL